MSNARDDPPGNNHALSAALGQIRLARNRSRIWVEAPDGKAFEPFQLPKLTASMIDWATAFCERFWEKHARCVGILLLLNTHTRAWSLGFPRQRCMHDAACRSTDRADGPRAEEDVRIGGSFQSRSLSGDDNFPAAVPLINGVHMVTLVGVEPRIIWTYLRIGDDISVVKSPEVIWDDILAVIDTHQPRFEIV